MAAIPVLNIPLNIPFQPKAGTVSGEPINWQKTRRRISGASWLADMSALKKTLALCRTCAWKMPWRWEKKFCYEELRQFHGVGVCDRCRNEDSVSLYLSTDTDYWAKCERDRRWSAETRARDRRFSIEDRRRVII